VSGSSISVPTSQMPPNWSFNRSANGWPPGPRGALVHHAPRGPGVHPSSPGQLCVRPHSQPWCRLPHPKKFNTLEEMQLALQNYVHKLTASWADMDFNAHMANTAYLNRAVDARMAFFTENGLPLAELMRLRVSWVMMKDEVEYRREIKWMEEISITVALAGLAPDGSRFRVRNDFFRADGQLAARVTSTGGFLDLDSRKLVVPPAELLTTYQAMPRTEDYEAIQSSFKAKTSQ
jgi:acyl-CoA thioester hydrolase